VKELLFYNNFKSRIKFHLTIINSQVNYQLCLLKYNMMIEITKVSGSDIFKSSLDTKIIEFDKVNMSEILAEAELPFPEEKRRKGFKNNPTFIVAWEADRIIGYLEYCRSWDNDKDIYISSLQISPEHRGGIVLLSIIDFVNNLLMNEEFSKIVSGVQKNNYHAIRLYKKLGFSFEDNQANDKSYVVSATKDIFCNVAISELIEKWHNKRIQQT